MRNFCVNKTTNERFARRANTVLSDTGSSRSSSRASSVFSSGQGTGSMQASNVEELLEKQRIAQSSCGWVSNCYQMCCDHTLEDQEDLLNTQRLTHDSSALEQEIEQEEKQRN